MVDSRGKVNHDIPLMMRAQSATTGSKNILFFQRSVIRPVLLGVGQTIAASLFETSDRLFRHAYARAGTRAHMV